MKLKNKRYERFAIEYAKTLNATQSAITAGYSAKTSKQQGSRLLTNVDIQKRISELSEAKENKAIASAEEVLEFLSDILRGAEKKPIGDDVMVFPVETKERIKAAELLGKRHALFTEKLEHSGEINNPFKELTTEELRKLAK